MLFKLVQLGYDGVGVETHGLHIVIAIELGLKLIALDSPLSQQPPICRNAVFALGADRTSKATQFQTGHSA
jgi:hypothetical protein